jgi:hypothetical protein
VDTIYYPWVKDVEGNNILKVIEEDMTSYTMG